MNDTPATTPEQKGTPIKKKENDTWTLMFFFASDNILSPSMLSQIKAIKSAGYQQDTRVLLHFDPNEKGAPTRVFEVNQKYRLSKSPSKIGDDDAPLVSALTGDDITRQAIGDLKKQEIDAMEAGRALDNFLTFCRKQYPADHYMLFMIGHGMIVGSDQFLPDDNPISAIGLPQLEDILKRFCEQAKSDHGGVLELLGMHSCSMSGVEVAYQLQDTARYMMASQGISFIGAWPYRQMLITIFRAIQAQRLNATQPVNVLELAQKLHELCIQHSADFMVGGYSADLCLCTLNRTNVGKLDAPIKSLGNALKVGLQHPRCRDLILLAHWKSQSYWQETYTDLYDFCLSLRRLCVKQDGKRPPLKDVKQSRPLRQYDQLQKAIEDACKEVMDKLEPRQATVNDGPVIRTDFIGAGSQYSHGLSIYFPWAAPVEDMHNRALTNYKNYAFASLFSTSAWMDFLSEYFKATKRPSRLDEDRDFQDQDVSYQSDPGFMKALAAAQQAFQVPGRSSSPSNTTSTLDQKISPPDAGGGGCVCSSIKNYSDEFLMSPGAAGVFVNNGASKDSAPNANEEEEAA